MSDSLLPSAYELKKFLMRPWAAYKRRQESDKSGFIKAALELHYYRPSFYRFIAATVANRHLLHEVELKQGDTVLDIGAYIGDWAEAILQRYPARVLAFEPNPASFQQLQEKTQRFPNLTPLPYGLGDEDLNTEISLKGMGSSLYSHHSDDDSTAHTAVAIRAVDSVWQELQLDRVALVKINIEGAEFPLLEKMIEADLLDRADQYLIQFHEWHPGAYSRRRRIRKALARTHRLVWDYHFVWEYWQRR